MSDQLSRTDRPIIRVAICGEVRAGKSAMLNALFRENLLTDNLGKDVRPIVFAEYGDRPSVQYIDANGKRHDTPLEGSAPIESVHVCHDKSDLARYAFVEIPLTNAEELSESHKALIGSSDIMVWVTIASQAWRLTEKTIVEELGEARPAHCILAISRADKLRRKADKDKILTRMRRETSDYFDEQILVANSKSQIETAAKSEKSWENSGASEIVAYLERMSGNTHRVVDADPEMAEPPASEEVAPHTEPPYSKATDHLIEASGEGTYIGVFAANSPKGCIALKGDPEVCQTLGDACRNLATRWLSAYGVEGDNIADFGVVVHSASRSIHYRKLHENDASVFMLSTVSEMTRGTAQVKHSQICQAIAGLA